MTIKRLSGKRIPGVCRNSSKLISKQFWGPRPSAEIGLLKTYRAVQNAVSLLANPSMKTFIIMPFQVVLNYIILKMEMVSKKLWNKEAFFLRK